MTDPVQINAELDRLLGQRLGVGGADFAAKLRRAGRLLPRRVRREAWFLVEAERKAGHPKLSKLLDARRVERAAEICRGHLGQIDAADRRWGILLGRLGVLVFNLLVLAALVIALLTWRGYLGPGAGVPPSAQSPG